MEVSTAIMLGIGSFILAILTKIAADEALAILPLISKWLLTKAVFDLPEGERVEFAHQVAASLKKWPGKAGRLFISLWYLIEAKGLDEIIRGAAHNFIHPPDHDNAIERIKAGGKGLALIVFAWLWAHHLGPLVFPDNSSTEFGRAIQNFSGLVATYFLWIGVVLTLINICFAGVRLFLRDQLSEADAESEP